MRGSPPKCTRKRGGITYVPPIELKPDKTEGPIKGNMYWNNRVIPQTEEGNKYN